jgi:hypothetical protein
VAATALVWRKGVQLVSSLGDFIQLGSSHTHTLRADPPLEQQVHSKVSLRRAVDAVKRGGVACVRSGAQGLWASGTTRKQPANLAVESAEDSLSILPDCTPTVRPPPKRS